MYETRPWEAGMTCWLDLMTTDRDAAKTFYGELLGWGFAEDPMPGDTPGTYNVATIGEGRLGGVNELREEQRGAGMPPSWWIYFAVDDVDATVAEAAEAGATVTQPAFDIPGTGRMAMLQGPTGEAFCVWQRTSPHAGQARFENAPGSFCWAELGTHDVDRAGGFYTRILPYDSDVQDMGEPMGPYTVFKVGDAPAAGMYRFPVEMAKVPPHWLPYFVVEDIDASTARAQDLGGAKICPIGEAPGVGRVVILRDPQGANFALLEPQMEAGG